MKLIPYPKTVEIKDGFLQSKTIFVKDMPKDERIVHAMKHFSLAEDGITLEISMGDSVSEAYSITVLSDKISVVSQGAAGAFYALQTLRQLFTEEMVPCCYIEDEPDFMHRGFYHDVTRGKVPTVATIKRLIDDMAYYKLNSLQLYVEHTFEFQEFADSIEKTGYLSAQEIQELDHYCRLNFIDFIPSIATFGHLYELLEKDKYRHLQEIDDFKSSEFFWENRMLHHTIDPTCEESFEIVKSLIDQYIVNFSSDTFNICCDETFDLKKGKHKDEDTGRLYLDFVTKIIKYLQGKGKTVMMWADILLNHPEQIENIPEDVQLLNWDYWGNPNEETFRTIQNSNRTQIVCPGTSTWSRLCEDYELEIINITKMVDYGYQYGAKGVLNTNWGDWGNPCSLELGMFGMVFGAAKSWNVKTAVDDDYRKSVDWLLYEQENGCQFVKRLSDLVSKINWNELAKCYGNILNNNTAYEIAYPKEEDVVYTIGESAKLIEDILSCKWQKPEYHDELVLATEGVALMAELFGLLAGYKLKRKTDTKEWLKKYREKWFQKNKASEYHEIEKMFITIDNGLTN